MFLLFEPIKFLEELQFNNNHSQCIHSNMMIWVCTGSRSLAETYISSSKPNIPTRWVRLAETHTSTHTHANKRCFFGSSINRQVFAELIQQQSKYNAYTLTSFETHIPQPLDDLGILCLPRRSTLPLFCHNKQNKLKQPIGHMVAPVILGNYSPTVVCHCSLHLFHYTL